MLMAADRVLAKSMDTVAVFIRQLGVGGDDLPPAA